MSIQNVLVLCANDSSVLSKKAQEIMKLFTK